MKNAIRISVKKPCTEKFENFNPTTAGGFCDSCQKEVIDFTTMTPKELVKHFNSTTGETCGRFKKSQLKTYQPIMNNVNNSFVSKGLAVMSFSLLSLCAISNVQAQDTASNDKPVETELNTVRSAPIVLGKIAIEKYTVKGTVLDQDDLPLPNVNVVLKGTTIGTTTDFDGKFEFPTKLEIDDILVFSYIGYDAKEHKIIASESNVIDVNMKFDASDINLMGEVVVGGAYASKRNIFQRIGDLFRK